MADSKLPYDKDTFRGAEPDTKFDMIYDLMAHVFGENSEDHAKIEVRLAQMESKMVSKARRDAGITAASGLVGGFVAVLTSKVLRGGA